MIIPLLGHDAADESLLGSANHANRIACPLNAVMDPQSQRVLDRAIDADWLRFVDVCPMPSDKGAVLVRVFMVTKAGLGRLSEIRERRKLNGLV